MIKSSRKLYTLTFNPFSEICLYKDSEMISAINSSIIVNNCNMDINAKLPSNNPVVKLYSLVQTNNTKGLILVDNLAYEKIVIVRYTLDNWNTYNDQECNYSYSVSDYLDVFSFTANLPNWISIEFAIKYIVNNTEYWDNNNGLNYTINNNL
jgi:hypothetical protein